MRGHRADRNCNDVLSGVLNQTCGRWVLREIGSFTESGKRILTIAVGQCRRDQQVVPRSVVKLSVAAIFVELDRDVIQNNVVWRLAVGREVVNDGPTQFAKRVCGQ